MRRLLVIAALGLALAAAAPAQAAQPLVCTYFEDGSAVCADGSHWDNHPVTGGPCSVTKAQAAHAGALPARTAGGTKLALFPDPHAGDAGYVCRVV